MSVLDNIYKAAQIGRTIGDPIGRGIEQRGQNQFEQQQALQRFEQQKKLQALAEQAAAQRQLEAFGNQIAMAKVENPAFAQNTFDLTPRRSQDDAPLSVPALPPNPTQSFALERGLQAPEAPLTRLGRTNEYTDPSGTQSILSAIAKQKSENDLGNRIQEIQAQEKARQAGEMTKPQRISVIDPETKRIREVAIRPGEDYQLGQNEIPLNQTAFYQGGISTKSDVAQGSKNTKREDDFVRQNSSELIKDPDVKNWEEFDRRTKQAHSLWNEAKKTGDYSAVTSHLLETYQRMNTNQAVRKFTYESVGGNQPLASRVEGWFEGIKRGGAGISDKTFEQLITAIDQMHGIAKEDVIGKLKGYEKAAEDSGFGDAFRKRVAPKFGVNLDGENVPRGTSESGGSGKYKIISIESK